MADTKPQIQEVQRTLSKMYREKITPGYILFKLQKTKGKEKIFKDMKEKRKITYQGRRIRIKLEYLSETMEAKSQ